MQEGVLRISIYGREAKILLLLSQNSNFTHIKGMSEDAAILW